MLFLLIILLALGFCFFIEFIILMLGLFKAGRRADDFEEEILKKMLNHKCEVRPVVKMKRTHS